MIFLGQASNYSASRTLKQLFVHGSTKHSAQLKTALAKKYQITPSRSAKLQYGNKVGGGICETAEERVALYHTGRSALAAALVAVAPKGSQVVIQGLTCIAVVRAVKAAGCEPVFADIDPETLQYDPKNLAQTLKNHPKAKTLIVQNTLGISSDIRLVEKIAERCQVKIVEDLAHSAGRFYADGREMGTIGVATALSFGKGKAIDTISGGALVLRDADCRMVNQPALLPKKADRRRDRWYPMLGALMRLGYRLHLGKFVAGGFIKLHWIQRSADAELNLDVKLPHWQAKLALKQLESLPKSVLREHQFVKDRDQVLEEFRENGFMFDEIWYDVPVSPARYADEVDFPVKRCPNTVDVASKIINLPTWYSPEKLLYAREIISEHAFEEEDE